VQRRMMKSKIHRATVTDANLNYVGSITIDAELMAAADIYPYEQVAVLDIDNGARFETYAIAGGRGEICLNGAAARLVAPGDKVIVLTYADYSADELEHYAPRIIHVDAQNQMTEPPAEDVGDPAPCTIARDFVPLDSQTLARQDPAPERRAPSPVSAS